MSIIEEIYKGKYKGYSINITAASLGGGKKVAIHEFPNTDIQTVEELGLKPRSYSIDIVVNGKTPADYIPEKFALLAILETPGAGLLTHPFYGDITNMVAVEWTMEEEDTTLGYGKLAVLFEPTAGTGIPTSESVTANDIQSDLLAAINIQTSEFPDTYSVTESFLDNISDAVNTGQNMVSSVKDATAFIGEVTTEINTLTAELDAFSDDIYSLILAPADLINSINSMFTSIGNLFDTPENTLKSFENLFGFGDDDVDLDATKFDTAINIERNQNRATFNSAINVNALAGAYVAASQLESATVDEINIITETLDAQFDKVQSSPDTPVSVRVAINTAAITVLNFFNEQRLTAAETVDITVQTSPARLIAFNYYNDSSRGVEIANLNNEPDISFIKGDIKILSD